ncbi:hypothetical protein IFM89_002042 [Coptis chinensis]|uniref:Zinc knuckle CX2CX4HX4C domain-containing protein n=1 Tax=Coptis chinensis TaxID=261450 RepID=A0A835GWF8_9MAGN|nr:hypothetical protein IFM89_002042 [Coptis chinensis]
MALGRPVQGYIFSLIRWEPNLTTAEMRFHWVPCWVQIFGLPVERHNIVDDLKKIWYALGQYVDSDTNSPTKVHTNNVLIKISLNTKDQLAEHVHLDIGALKPLKVRVKYERLPIFCYFCGILGHDHKGCTLKHRLLEVHPRIEKGSSKKNKMDESEVQVSMEGNQTCLLQAYISRASNLETRGDAAAMKGKKQIPHQCALVLAYVTKPSGSGQQEKILNGSDVTIVGFPLEGNSLVFNSNGPSPLNPNPQKGSETQTTSRLIFGPSYLSPTEKGNVLAHDANATARDLSPSFSIGNPNGDLCTGKSNKDFSRITSLNET